VRTPHHNQSRTFVHILHTQLGLVLDIIATFISLYFENLVETDHSAPQWKISQDPSMIVFNGLQFFTPPAWVLFGFSKQAQFLNAHCMEFLIQHSSCQTPRRRRAEDVVDVVDPEWGIAVLICVQILLMNEWRCAQQDRFLLLVTSSFHRAWCWRGRKEGRHWRVCAVTDPLNLQARPQPLVHLGSWLSTPLPP
jgi:hypothetical protein